MESEHEGHLRSKHQVNEFSETNEGLCVDAMMTAALFRHSQKQELDSEKDHVTNFTCSILLQLEKCCCI